MNPNELMYSRRPGARWNSWPMSPCRVRPKQNKLSRHFRAHLRRICTNFGRTSFHRGENPNRSSFPCFSSPPNNGIGRSFNQQFGFAVVSLLSSSKPHRIKIMHHIKGIAKKKKGKLVRLLWNKKKKSTEDMGSCASKEENLAAVTPRTTNNNNTAKAGGVPAAPARELLLD